MREFKFRAWDRTQFPARMIEWEQLKQSPCYAVFINCIEVNIMQYIGMNDYKNQDVYEGDIIKWPNQDELGVVKWINNRFEIVGKLPSCSPGLQFGNKGQAVVIGNIYENPELIAQNI